MSFTIFLHCRVLRLPTNEWFLCCLSQLVCPVSCWSFCRHSLFYPWTITFSISISVFAVALLLLDSEFCQNRYFGTIGSRNIRLKLYFSILIFFSLWRMVQDWEANVITGSTRQQTNGILRPIDPSILIVIFLSPYPRLHRIRVSDCRSQYGWRLIFQVSGAKSEIENCWNEWRIVNYIR